MNSIGIWVYEISRLFARKNDVTVYARRGFSAPKRKIGGNVRTQHIHCLPRNWVTRLDDQQSNPRNPKKPRISSLAYHLEYALGIALHLRRTRADIVHLQNYTQFVPVIRALNPDIKIVLHMRCDWLALFDYAMVDRRLEQTDLILGVSDAITNAVRQRFPHHAEKCFTSYTGVDTDTFRPLDVHERSPEKPKNLLYVGRITPEKGVHVLLEAFRQVAPCFPELHLNLVGSIVTLPRDWLVALSNDQNVRGLEVFYNGVEYEDHLQAIVPPELRDRVHYNGHVLYNDIVSYYQQTEVLVNPALHEPFGRSLIEANACGIPGVASSTGGMTETIEHGKNGFLVQPGNAEELARAIVVLLENDALRRSLGNTGRQMAVNRFSWGQIAARLKTVYDDLGYDVPL